mgnify:FL=1
MGYFELDMKQEEQLASIFKRIDKELSPFATQNVKAIRKNAYTNDDLFRSEFGIDIDKILHNVLYNRYVDKTQVFSFYKNDDITRRALHVQLVARIAKIIGQALELNLDLIEAIAIGHDIGHTPFGHKGETFLSELYYEHRQRYFNHNVHSVRNLMIVTTSNLTLQTYDGILCHCGEKAFDEYYPNNITTFDEFMEIYEKCYIEKDYIETLRPSTLEGCVVRISDMIAYLAKDRQDASKANLCKMKDFNTNSILGKTNIELVNNIIKNIVKNSMGKSYLKIDKVVYDEMCRIKDENNKKIYSNVVVNRPYFDIVKPMMEKIYEKMRADVENRNFNSPIFKHHLNHPILGNCYRNEKDRSIIANIDDIVVDYIASMTDDYFLDLFMHEFPNDELCEKINYVQYFE